MGIESSLSSWVRHRARHACEYCRLPEAESDLPFTIDHIIARQHGGLTVEGNLALACPCCNLHKGPNVAGIDPHSGKLTPIFHPRQSLWSEHFCWDGVAVVPVSAIGRTTIMVLAMNDPRQIAVRRSVYARVSVAAAI